MSVERATREVGPFEFLRWQEVIKLEEEKKYEETWEQRTPVVRHLEQLAQYVYLLIRRVDGMMQKTDMPYRDADEFKIEFVRADGKRNKDEVESLKVYDPDGDAAKSAEYKEWRSKASRCIWAARLGVPEIMEA